MRHKSFCVIFTCLLVAGFCVTASAADTSPYLVSDFYSGTTEYSSFFIGNPTPGPLLIFAAFYNDDGVFSTCVSNVLSGNNTWYVAVRDIELPQKGVVKFFAFPGPLLGFFAFPSSSLRLDPNAVIGGFKQQVECRWTFTGPPFDGWYYQDQVQEMNIKAVTINSSTIGEFQAILRRDCQPYGGSYMTPRVYCGTLPLPY